jgi:hypothetical protein
MKHEIQILQIPKERTFKPKKRLGGNENSKSQEEDLNDIAALAS